MARPNRYDVARKVGELSPATTEGVKRALGEGVDAEQVDRAFERAEQHGLLEREGTGADAEGARWKLTDKGREKLAAESEET